MRYLCLHHHCVFLCQGAAKWERSGKGYPRFNLVHILVRPLDPGRALHAGVPVRAVGIHGEGRTCYVGADFPDASNQVSICHDPSGWAVEMRVKSSGGWSSVVDSSKQQFLCVCRTQKKSKQDWGRVTFTSSQSHSAQWGRTSPGKYCEGKSLVKVAPKSVFLGSRWKSQLGPAFLNMTTGGV